MGPPPGGPGQSGADREPRAPGRADRAVWTGLSQPAAGDRLRAARQDAFSDDGAAWHPRPPAPDAGAIEEIAERLMRAREPVIVAGCGRNPAEVPALVEL